jgi:hypothetical protein
MKSLIEFIKEWIIGKLGGIPMNYLDDVELQRLRNHITNKAIDMANKNNYKL